MSVMNTTSAPRGFATTPLPPLRPFPARLLRWLLQVVVAVAFAFLLLALLLPLVALLLLGLLRGSWLLLGGFFLLLFLEGYLLQAGCSRLQRALAKD